MSSKEESINSVMIGATLSVRTRGSSLKIKKEKALSLRDSSEENKRASYEVGKGSVRGSIEDKQTSPNLKRRSIQTQLEQLRELDEERKKVQELETWYFIIL
jgi:hypothetical protein